MLSHQDVACAAVSHLDSPPEADVARLQAEVSTLRADNQRAECMASIQRDAVQLALDLLVTHPDLRAFFRMFIKRLVDDSGAPVDPTTWQAEHEQQERELRGEQAEQ